MIMENMIFYASIKEEEMLKCHKNNILRTEKNFEN